MLTTRHPMFVFWGPDLYCFYNDAYSRSIGPEKHPALLGARGRDMWQEVWPVIGPQIQPGGLASAGAGFRPGKAARPVAAATLRTSRRLRGVDMRTCLPA